MGIAILAALLLGCASAYDEAPAKGAARLEREHEAGRARQEAARAEALTHAAVVYFDVNSAAIPEEGCRELDWFAQQLQPHPEAIVQVRGFADPTGTEMLNPKLPEQRAEAVTRYLASRGIDPARLRTEGLPSESAARPDVTAEGRQRERRVEVTVR